ncbi:Leucine-rich repeat, ribonuclease inhibitor subtype [Corchorus olitorius]|uniref:Leucine-rich repeat, ribonuclease inhibitor subtype n=1 Tax=Corchorus olitorius TaxID=93759 RepID=A0A1R3KH06_9ROSI|nr:Leucine-rich repeat, ribonuclease inhibitor subtype [Corchorus olitorius]
MQKSGQWRMVKVPSLVSLSIDVVKRELLHGDDFIPHIYELPPELFNSLVKCLPPSTLQKLQTEMPFKTYDDYESTSDYIKSSRKRGRSGNFNTAWKELFTLRWPDLVDRIEPDDWQQIYWETHVQNCLDEAAELALLPSFGGCLGEIQISEKILRYIGYVDHMEDMPVIFNWQGIAVNTSPAVAVMMFETSKCALCCRILSTFEELQVTKLGCTVDPICGTCINITTFEFHRIEVMDHLFGVIEENVSSYLNGSVFYVIQLWCTKADGLCKLLSQNCKTLTSLKFIHCKLSSTFVDAICDSLSLRGAETHQIQHFSISSSSFLEPDPVNSAHRLASFLSSGRSLRSLKLCNSHLDWNFARRVLSTLLDASSSISILDLSENNITGWLLNFNWRSSALLSSLGVAQSLQSLCVLNLRGNNLQKDDASNLKYALVQMPSLETLDLSDNPIEDDGIRCLIPYIAEASKTFSPLDHLNLENCELSHDGVTQLLNALSTLRKPLNSLSIADNGLGSQVAEALGNFWSTSIQVFNLEGIGLGPSGFRKLQDVIMEDLMLVEINISKNRGGIETSKFLSKLIQQAPKLVAVNAAYNLMPVESLTFICSALKTARGHLKQVDLTGNIWDYQPSHDAMLSEFQHNGKPILILPSSVASNVHYDDDP